MTLEERVATLEKDKAIIVDTQHRILELIDRAMTRLDAMETPIPIPKPQNSDWLDNPGGSQS